MTATPDERIVGERKIGRRLALGAGSMVAGSALLRPSHAAATTGTFRFGAMNDAGDDGTGLRSSGDSFTLDVRNLGSGGAASFSAGSSGSAVEMTSAVESNTAAVFQVVSLSSGSLVRLANVQSDNSAAVIAIEQNGSGPLLVGSTASPEPAVTVSNGGNGPAANFNSGGDAAAVEVRKQGSGHGVDVRVSGARSSGTVVRAETTGLGRALTAFVNNQTNAKPAARIETTGSGIGVEAVSRRGRGGRFVGTVAQLQLAPASGATHPAMGAAGDLYVDRSTRLWFCKGGSVWTQVA